MANQSSEQAAREAVERVMAARAGRLPEPNLDPATTDLPASIRTALAAYDAMPEWLVNSTFRHLCRIPSNVGELYLLIHGFESTDGWLEVFDPDGTPLGAAQYIRERDGWASVEEVRQSLQTGTRVPALEASPGWSSTPGGGYRSACGRFEITPVKGSWRLTMNGKFIQAWDTLEDAQGQARALALPVE